MDFPATYDSPDVWNSYTALQHVRLQEKETKAENTSDDAVAVPECQTTTDTISDQQMDNPEPNQVALDNENRVTIIEDSIVIHVDPESIDTSAVALRPRSLKENTKLSPYWQCFTAVYNVTGNLISATCNNCLLSICPKPARLELHLNNSKSCRAASGLPVINHRVETLNPEESVGSGSTSRKSSSSTPSCFICGKNRVKRTIFETFEVYPSDWGQSMGKSLCKLLQLEDPIHQILSSGTYCSTCAQLLRDINWVERSINTLNSKLLDLRDTVISQIGNCFYTNDWKCNKSAFVQNLKGKGRGKGHGHDQSHNGSSAELPLPNSLPNFNSEVEIKVEKVIMISRNIFENNQDEDMDFQCPEPYTDPLVSGPVQPDDCKFEDDDTDWVPDQEVKTKPTPRGFPSFRETRGDHNTRSKKLTKVDLDHDPDDGSVQNIGKIRKDMSKWNLRIVACPVQGCTRRFTRPCKADLHVRKDHDKDPTPYHCTTIGCDAKFNYRKKLETHRRKDHVREKVKGPRARVHQNLPCPVSSCARVFKARNLLNHHVQNVHYPKMNFLYCQYCSKSFRKGKSEEETAQEVQFHESLHTNHPVPFSCVINPCVQSFPTSRDLRQHVGSEHDENRFHCDVCPGTFFMRKSSLKEHRRRLHPETEKRYVCDYPGCDYSSVLPGNLRSHSLTHKEERPFKCDQCEMAYKTKRNLQSHFNMIHSNETPYSCHHCELKFKSSRLLNIHEVTHTANPSSHLCSGCGKEFGNLSNLTTHVNYRCPKGPALSTEAIESYREKCRNNSRIKRAKWRELYGYDRLPPALKNIKQVKVKGRIRNVLDTTPAPPPVCEEVEINSEGTW